MEDKDKINLFISYSHKDKKKKAFVELMTHLRSGIANKINTWSDQEIELGSKWDTDIQNNLAKADIVILVISSDFLLSDYIKNKELKPILERDEKEECVVIPLFFRHCNWKEHGFKDNQGFPSDNKVIYDMTFTERDLAFTNFEQKITDLYAKIIEKRRKNKIERNPSHNEKTDIQKPNQDLHKSERASLPKPELTDCKFHAVIIVNYEYDYMHEKNIPNIRANLNALQAVFTNDIKIPKENIQILDNKSSNDLLEDLVNIIEKFPQDTTLFVYYSGHGIPDSDDFFWATRNTRLKENKNEINTGTAYETSKIRKLLERSGLKQKIMVVDCCYAAEVLAGTQSMTIDGYMQKKVNLSNTFYFFSSEASKESMYPVAKPEEATYFTQALVKAFIEEIKEGESNIIIGKIYNKTALFLGEFRRKNSKIPSPIKQPKDNSLDNIILFPNPNKPSKSAIEFQTSRASETRDIVEEALEKQGNEILERIEKANLNEEERKKIAIQNVALVEIMTKHSEINSIQDAKERRIQQAKLAVEADMFPMVARALMRKSQAEVNNLNKAADKNKP